MHGPLVHLEAGDPVTRRLRITLTVVVALAGGGGLAYAQEALRAAAPPEIVTDLEGPLFALQAMTPGQLVQRCVTVYPRGGTADDVFVYGATRGQLAPMVHQEVAAGRAADGVRASRTCEGFVPDRVLWGGTLDEFPTSGVPLQDAARLAPGEPRVYRFSVRLQDTGSGVPLNWVAEQDLQWRANMEPTVTTPTQTTTVTQTEVVTVQGPERVQTTPVPAPSPQPAAPPAPRCAAQPGERPVRTFDVGGRRVAFMVGPTRRLKPGEPLVLRVRDPAGVVHRATYDVDGRRMAAQGARPWKAALPVGFLRDDVSRVTVRLETVDGKLRHGRVELRKRDCPPIVRATAPAASPASITVDLDPGVAVARAGLALPAGVVVARRGLAATARPQQRVRLAHRAGRVSLGLVRAGTALHLTIPVDRGSRAALAAARCARSEVVVRLEPVDGPVRYLRVPLMGRAGGCGR